MTDAVSEFRNGFFNVLECVNYVFLVLSRFTNHEFKNQIKAIKARGKIGVK